MKIVLLLILLSSCSKPIIEKNGSVSEWKCYRYSGNIYLGDTKPEFCCAKLIKEYLAIDGVELETAKQMVDNFCSHISE